MIYFMHGHLENLLIASENSEKLIVGVKSDELVQAHKKKTPVLSAEERMEILRHFKFVDDAYIYYTRDLHIARDWIESKYGKLDAVFFGSDLKADFKGCNDINIVYTDRPPELLSTRSTTAYRKKLFKNKPVNLSNTVLTGKINIGDTTSKTKDASEKDLDEEILR